MDRVFQRVMWALTLIMPACVFLGLVPGYFYWLFTGDGVTAKQVTRFGVKAGLVSALFFLGCISLYAGVAFCRLLRLKGGYGNMVYSCDKKEKFILNRIP